MGTDDLFHKRRKQKEQNSRDKTYGKRSPKERVLIICEDKKSAKYYLEDFCKEHGLQQRVEIKTCPDGNDPLNIVKHAKKEIEYYAKIYCVFDNDVEPIGKNMNYEKALSKCTGKIVAINSVPNFEYWLLTHYVCWLQPFRAIEKYTIGEMVVKELEKYLKDYSKGIKGIYEKTKHLLEKAMENAKKVAIEQAKVNTDNPSTKFHLLISDLQSLSKNSVL